MNMMMSNLIYGVYKYINQNEKHELPGVMQRFYRGYCMYGLSLFPWIPACPAATNYRVLRWIFFFSTELLMQELNFFLLFFLLLDAAQELK